MLAAPRTISLLWFCLLSAGFTGCELPWKSDLDGDSGASDDRQDGDDPDPTDDSGGDDDGPCTGSEGQTICIDGDAVVCDADGAVASTTTCTEPDAVCEDSVGCTSCAVLLDAAHATDGVSTRVTARGAVEPESFGWERFYMRPITISAQSADLQTGAVAVEVDGEGLHLWTTDGEALGQSTSLQTEDLPTQLLVQAASESTATITAVHDDCPSHGGEVAVHGDDARTLTGFPLSDFPYFEWNQVFNADEVIRTALDPEVHSDRLGATYSVYVVERRSGEEWATDASLTHIGTGAVESATVTAGTVSDNIVDAISGGITVASDLTQALDVILDFNDNAQLDPGDIALGPGDASPAFTAVGDLSLPGPHTTVVFEHGVSPWNVQRVYYPVTIDDLDPAPLIVISHGNGHHYTWYDYLGYHLASHGYVVMAHTNNTGPGIETASTTTLTNTDYLLEHLDSADGGALDGNIDSSRIIWIGHSRGGEGVVRAYDRIVDEGYGTEMYVAEDIILISSIAPTVFYDVEISDPHDKPYHLFAGAADGDVTGGPNWPSVQFFRLVSAAESATQTTLLQGVGHNEFNCCGFHDATGPDLIGREAAQVIARSYYLALIRGYADGDETLMSFIKRRADVFRPMGISDTAVIANTYRPDPVTDALIIDDFQTESSVETSAIGGAVTITASNAFEDRLTDKDARLRWLDSDPMNGMTQGGSDYDENRGLVLDWADGDAVSATWEIPSSAADFSGYTSLSFRACQGSRHPYTVALGDSLDFTVTLVDGAGEESSIPFGELGRITTPYLRSGLGTGSGWSNEFNTIRLRLTDFQAAGSALDLGTIAAIRFDFGADAGSSTGRIGIDDLLLEL